MQGMRLSLLTTLALFASGLLVRADDEKLPLLKAGNNTYTNVTVTSVSATDIYFTYAGGMENVKIKNLSPDLQKHFNFDPKKAKAAEIEQVKNKARYHDQLIHQPAVAAPDMTREQTAGTRSTEAVWRNDFRGALQQAQADKKLLLLNFTGSDWCAWCIKFDAEVLSTPKFAAYADKKLELVKVDFPNHSTQSEELKAANAALKQAMHIEGFPTYILLNADGHELGRQVGYLKGGPDAFIAELEVFSNH